MQHRLKPSADHPEIKIIRNFRKIPVVECYPSQLNQVFMNIFSNSIDALEECALKQCKPPATLEISTDITADNWVKIRIADNGPGFEPEVANKLFEPFFTTKAIGKGTGLGLSISRQIIVEKHKGKIQCHSVPGQGTEFIIDIPCQQPHANQ